MNAALARRTVTRHRGTLRLLVILEFDGCKSDGERGLGAMRREGGPLLYTIIHPSSAHMYVG